MAGEPGATADRRAEIVRTAARLFRERGYAGTTVRELAREVGLTSGSIFHHFSSKEAVLLAVVERGLDEATRRMVAADAADHDPAGRLRRMIHAHLAALHEGSPEAMSVLFHERWTLSEASWRRLVELRDAYERLWDDALAALGPPYDDPARRRVHRLLLLGSMNWTAQWYRPDGDLRLDDLTAALAERYLP